MEIDFNIGNYSTQKQNQNTNKNIKPIKKLDLRAIDQQKNEPDQQKQNLVVKNKSDLEREHFAERQISKDLEKYIEFLSKEDELCDKLLNFNIPYFFLGINNKQSLSTNGKEILDQHNKSIEDFLKRIEKKLDKETAPSQQSNNFSLSSSFGGLSIFNNQKNTMGRNTYKKRKFNK